VHKVHDICHNDDLQPKLTSRNHLQEWNYDICYTMCDVSSEQQR